MSEIVILTQIFCVEKNFWSFHGLNFIPIESKGLPFLPNFIGIPYYSMAHRTVLSHSALKNGGGGYIFI